MPEDRKRKAKGGSANLMPPVAPGEVRNPKGINQYTYKRKFENMIDKLCNGSISDKDLKSLPSWVRDAIEPGMSGGEALAKVSFLGALAGDGKMHPELLKRIYPATERHEHTGAGGEALNHSALEVNFSNLSKEQQQAAQDLAHAAMNAGEDS